MKNLLFSGVFFLFLNLNAQNKITVGTSYSNYIKIVEVENTEAWTEVMLEFNPTSNSSGTLHAPSGKSPYVITDKKGNRYALISQTGWGGSLSGGFGSAQLKAYKKKYVKLFFNRLKNVNDIYSLTEVDCDGTNCWNFYDIKISTGTTKVNSSSNSNSSSSSSSNKTKTTYVNTSSLDKSKVSAKFEKTWIDYDVYDDSGNYGMRIHTKFFVYNMEKQKCYFTIRFMKGEDFLKTSDVAYKNISGQIELKKSLTPAYASTVYNDKAVFMPYNKLNLSAGEHMVKCDVDIFYADGTLLKHLGFKEFKYTKN
ncbi:hypothetical protein [Ascidiimonas sp. W6]|uniref:hypothetical protein n=1 Tax=Ascidiimonas meishanensis TaxID=3128903 RepID=UPI0030ED3914